MWWSPGVGQKGGPKAGEKTEGLFSGIGQNTAVSECLGIPGAPSNIASFRCEQKELIGSKMAGLSGSLGSHLRITSF